MAFTEARDADELKREAIMAWRRTAVGVFVLVVWGAEVAAQPRPTPVQAGAEFEAQLKEALGKEEVEAAAA